MRNLHPDVAETAKEVIVKSDIGFRLRMEKWEAINPKGLYSVDLIQESLDDEGQVRFSSTYNFHMTKAELQKLAEGLVS